ncbi:MAG: cation transporter [Desulfobacteraceae bacterium]|nr:cation transporter [Desulfobacteraceae bacterium]
MKTVKIEGMTCNHCKMSVIKALEEIQEGGDVKVDLEKGEASFQEAEAVDRLRALTARQVRRALDRATGCGPEAIQFLAVTRPHVTNMMDKRKIPFMALIDKRTKPKEDSILNEPASLKIDPHFSLGRFNLSNQTCLYSGIFS